MIPLLFCSFVVAFPLYMSFRDPWRRIGRAKMEDIFLSTQMSSLNSLNSTDVEDGVELNQLTLASSSSDMLGSGNTSLEDASVTANSPPPPKTADAAQPKKARNEARRVYIEPVLRLLADSKSAAAFQQYCVGSFCSELYAFQAQATAFRQIKLDALAAIERAVRDARRLLNVFVVVDAESEINITDKARKNTVARADDFFAKAQATLANPSSTLLDFASLQSVKDGVFREAVAEVFFLLREEIFPRFATTSEGIKALKRTNTTV